ncbi:hypothetical protein XB02_08360 [Pantoea ananatis]|nr:hypothetical protein XB02_08360 [Pantoea ananatis]
MPRRGRLRQGRRIRTVRQAAVSDEGTATADGRRDFKGWRKPLNPAACTDWLKLPSPGGRKTPGVRP